MIYTIGDSHSKFGWDKINGVYCNWLGPKLMYTFKKDDFNINNISENDHIVFCFGEIDVRCHIKKNTIDNDYESVIDNICQRYVNEILEIKKIHNIKNIHVYNIVPTRRIETKEPYLINCDNYIEFKEDPTNQYPHVGSDLDRKSYTLFFNKKLKSITKVHNLGFIDIYDKYIDIDGYLNMNLSDGCVHISDEKYLLDFIVNNF